MPLTLRCPRVSLAWLAACTAALLLTATGDVSARLAGDAKYAAAAAGTREVRALWVTRTTLTSPGAIANMAKLARAARFNTLFVQVRGRGDAYYRSDIEPRAQALASQPPTFDPLALVLAEARRAGLRVHAWISVGLVASAVELPASRAHVVHQHPEWLMVPRQGAEELNAMGPRSPQYAERLARTLRQQSAEVEGIYLSPVDPGAVDHTCRVVRELLGRYAVDGVHLDYVRYPNDEFDYSAHAMELFAQTLSDTGSSPSSNAAREGKDRVGFTEESAERWRQFRMARLTTLVERVSAAAREARPRALVTAAVLPDANDAASRRLQDWRRWLESGLLDAVCPMAYATDLATLNAQLAGARQAAGTTPVWAGIGAYRLSPAQTIDAVRVARRHKAAGVVLFSYDSLVGVPPSGRVLSKIGHAVFKD